MFGRGNFIQDGGAHLFERVLIGVNFLPDVIVLQDGGLGDGVFLFGRRLNLPDGPHERLLGAGLAAGGHLFGHGMFHDLSQAAARRGAVGGQLGDEIRRNFVSGFEGGGVFVLGGGSGDFFGHGEGFLLLFIDDANFAGFDNGRRFGCWYWICHNYDFR